MLRFLLLALILPAAIGCGRSTPYTYPPGTVLPLKPGQIPLPDGGVLIVPITPTLTCKPIESDKYTLPPKEKKPIDVLFVIDDSASMKDDQDAVAANFKSFISSFSANQIDFHIGVVTTDMVKQDRAGRLVKPFLVPTTLKIAEAFDAMVKVGVSGSPDEKGLLAARAALSEPLLSSTANKGFLRPAADLGIVFVADEDDHDKATVDSYVTFFKGLKSDISAVSVSSIALQNGLICSTNGWRYVQVAKAFGPRGLVSSCTPDYAETLKAIGGRLVASHCVIGLKRWLEDGTKVQVLVNGAPSSFIPFPPDPAYPNGSLQVLTCPSGGGTVEIVYEECFEQL